MTKRRPDTRQGNLFTPRAAPAAEAWQIDAEWRGAMSAAIAESGKSRDAIAAEMEAALGSDADYPVSRAMLDAWTAPSRTAWRFPVIYLAAFIEATGADWLLELIARRRGLLVMSGEQALEARLGRVRADRKRLEGEERELLKKIGGRR